MAEKSGPQVDDIAPDACISVKAKNENDSSDASTTPGRTSIVSPAPDLTPRGITIELTHKLKDISVTSCHSQLSEGTKTEYAPSDPEIPPQDPACFQYGQNQSLTDLEGKLAFQIVKKSAASAGNNADKCYLCVTFSWLLSEKEPTYTAGFAQASFDNFSDLHKKSSVNGTGVKLEANLTSTGSSSYILKLKVL